MGRLLKFLLFFTVTFILILAGTFFVDYLRLPANPLPYPYRFLDEGMVVNTLVPPPTLLLVGDRLAKSFADTALSTLEQTISEKTKGATFLSWAREGEGLHRTLHRLQLLKEWPPLILYYGGGEEEFEQITEKDHEETLFFNLSRYKNPYFKTVLNFWPSFSRWLYRPLLLRPLKMAIEKDKVPRSEKEFLRYREIHYQLYEILLEELILEARKKKSGLILMTSPLNLFAGPKRVCTLQTSPQILAIQDRLQKNLTLGEFEEGLSTAKKLEQMVPGNALTHYLWGLLLLKQGGEDEKNREEAFYHLELAQSFDCAIWRGNVIYNHIMRKMAYRYSVPLIDYQSFTRGLKNEGSYFADEIFPSDTTNQEMAKLLGNFINKQHLL